MGKTVAHLSRKFIYRNALHFLCGAPKWRLDSKGPCHSINNNNSHSIRTERCSLLLPEPTAHALCMIQLKQVRVQELHVSLSIYTHVNIILQHTSFSSKLRLFIFICNAFTFLACAVSLNLLLSIKVSLANVFKPFFT
jgi:hypothetical protein